MLGSWSRSLLSIGVVVVALAACGDDEPSSTDRTGSTTEPLKDAQPVAVQYAKNVFANYTDCLVAAQALKTAVDAFVAAPSAATHQAAKDAWIASRKPYGRSEVHRFYGGPIDDEATGVEGELNAWPLDENFVDYTREAPESGLINDPSITLTKDVLRGQNEQGGEKNIAVGYHAIEFLLWGQDDVDPTKKTAGARSFEDYVAGSTTAKNQDRRGQYLRLLAEILVEDLTTVTAAWEPNKDNYARSFVADPKVAVTRILTGMGSLANAELSGERMTVAYKNKGQEDEHSCFSDTTNADLQGNFRGLEDAYLGSYEASAGVGIDRLVAAVDPALDAKVKTDLAAAAAAFGVLQAVPFDLAIQSAEGTPERQAVLTAIEAVKVLARDVEAVGAKLGVTFALEKPSEDL